MRYGLGQNSGAAVTDDPRATAAPAVGVKEIPYDYVAKFKLTGTRGTRHQDVITISTEGTFVAVSVGYSFVPRTTIRIEIEEVSIGPLFAEGTLFLVLHGYKRLGE